MQLTVTSANDGERQNEATHILKKELYEQFSVAMYELLNSVSIKCYVTFLWLSETLKSVLLCFIQV